MQGLPPEPLKFTLNASLNTLPTNAVLHTWGKKPRDTCTLRREHRQSLLHILNNCQVDMDLRRYSERHDSVLKTFGDFIKSSLPPLYSVTTDTYSFPHHITPTNLRPDIVWWGERQRELWLFELTISYETLMAEARERKRAKYQDLVEAGRAAGYKTELITVEVGSRGMLDPSDLEPLAAAISCHHKDIRSLYLFVIRTTLLESWYSRNTVTP